MKVDLSVRVRLDKIFFDIFSIQIKDSKVVLVLK